MDFRTASSTGAREWEGANSRRRSTDHRSCRSRRATSLTTVDFPLASIPSTETNTSPLRSLVSPVKASRSMTKYRRCQFVRKLERGPASSAGFVAGRRCHAASLQAVTAPPTSARRRSVGSRGWWTVGGGDRGRAVRWPARPTMEDVAVDISATDRTPWNTGDPPPFEHLWIAPSCKRRLNAESLDDGRGTPCS